MGYFGPDTAARIPLGRYFLPGIYDFQWLPNSDRNEPNMPVIVI